VTMYRLAQAFAVLGILLWFASGLWERLNLKDRPSAIQPGKRPVQPARQRDGSPMYCDERVASLVSYATTAAGYPVLNGAGTAEGSK
jgi:hypothetical protein